MSFILDALKKSDAKRQAQLGPGLSVPTAPATATTPKSPRPLMVWGLFGALGLVVIGSIGFWWGSRPGEIAGSRTDAVLPAAEVNQMAKASAPAADVEAGLEPPVLAESPIATAQLAADTAAPQFESESEPQPESITSFTSSSSALASEAPTVNTADSAQTAVMQVGEELRGSLPAPDSSAVKGLERRLSASASDDVGDGANTPEEEVLWQPEAPDYLYQWELPLSVRESLPALNLVVHVYSKKPEDRFVLINGTRFREGDELSQGARLAEIRPEGALVDFRDYRFLVTQ